MIHIVWFRNDLRLHDHAALTTACRVAREQHAQLLPIYVVDPRDFGLTRFGFPRVGAFRRRFLRESLQNLDDCLREIGSRLLILTGRPEAVFAAVAQQLGNVEVHCYREFAPEEEEVASAVRRSVQEAGGRLRMENANTLHDSDDLPFELRDTPDVFSRFRRVVEKSLQPPGPLPVPEQMPPLPERLPDAITKLQDVAALRGPDPLPDARSQMEFEGGETAGLRRLSDYIWEQDRLRIYKQTRNGMLRPNDSSRFSPWLALGCVSPRKIHADVQRYERERVQNDSTYWLVFELLWRDYFAFTVAKHGSAVFRQSGLRRQPLAWCHDVSLFAAWQQGQTGYPLIDANMRELSATGFMSNRGRQNVASFLTKNLGVDWRMGAEWFESQLIDYDACSNYGNWNYAAGIGNDARGFRWFNTIKQAGDYDPQGEYVRHWLPELSNVPIELIHTPWKMSPAQQELANCSIGVDYPKPVVDLFKSASDNEARYRAAVSNGRS